MNALVSVVSVVAFMAGIGIITTQPVHGYLDPGSVSLMVQVLVGGLLAGLGMIGVWWARAKGKAFRFLSWFKKNDGE